MEKTFTISEKVEVLRGRHKGRTGTLRNIEVKEEYTIYTVRFSEEKNDWAYLGQGDIKSCNHD